MGQPSIVAAVVLVVVVVREDEEAEEMELSPLVGRTGGAAVAEEVVVRSRQLVLVPQT